MDKPKKILITGATGMLGKALFNEILKKTGYELYYISYSKEFLSNDANLLSIEMLKDFKFYAFFHCAAEVNVNLCEKDLDHAIRANRDYSKVLFEHVNARYNFYISTDSVYEGIDGNYKETDKATPINNYAKSKLMGEEVASKSKVNLFIIRTNIIGKNSKSKSSLFEWANRELSSGNSIQGFRNIFFNPLSVNHLSKIMLKMLEDKVQYGIYNLGCDRNISKYDFLVKVAKLIGVNTDLVKPADFVASSEMAIRPMNSTINCEKIKEQLKIVDLSLDKSLELLIKS